MGCEEGGRRADAHKNERPDNGDAPPSHQPHPTPSCPLPAPSRPTAMADGKFNILVTEKLVGPGEREKKGGIEKGGGHQKKKHTFLSPPFFPHFHTPF